MNATVAALAAAVIVAWWCGTAQAYRRSTGPTLPSLILGRSKSSWGRLSSLGR
jgi:hypothetical protein